MQKNKIILASLISLFSLNAAANPWMPTSAWLPSKDNALVYATGGLVLTTAYLVVKVSQLTTQNDKQKLLNKDLVDGIGSNFKHHNEQVAGLQGSINDLANVTVNRNELTDYATKSDLTASQAQVKAGLTAVEKRIIETVNSSLKDVTVKSLDLTALKEDFAALKEALCIAKLTAEQSDKALKDTLNKQIEELGARLIKLIAENKSSNQAEIEAIRKELITFATTTDFRALTKDAKANIDRIDGLVAIMQQRLKSTEAPTVTAAAASGTATTPPANSSAASKK